MNNKYLQYTKHELLKILYTNINHKDKKAILQQLEKKTDKKNILYI